MDAAIYSEVRDKILACTEGMQKLDNMLGKCTENTQSSTLRARMREQANRALYPFKRESLLNIKDTLEGLQANLGTALQV